MSGKDYVIEAGVLGEKVLSECRSSGKLEGDSLLEKMATACESLEKIRNKPSLRTRDGEDKAYPILESAQRLEEDWEDAQDGDDMQDVRESMEVFVDAADALINALKGKTVVMT